MRYKGCEDKDHLWPDEVRDQDYAPAGADTWTHTDYNDED